MPTSFQEVASQPWGLGALKARGQLPDSVPSLPSPSVTKTNIRNREKHAATSARVYIRRGRRFSARRAGAGASAGLLPPGPPVASGSRPGRFSFRDPFPALGRQRAPRRFLPGSREPSPRVRWSTLPFALLRGGLPSALGGCPLASGVWVSVPRIPGLRGRPPLRASADRGPGLQLAGSLPGLLLPRAPPLGGFPSLISSRRCGAPCPAHEYG